MFMRFFLARHLRVLLVFVLVLITFGTATRSVQATTSLLLNELNVNPPSTDQPFEYAEIIGPPGEAIDAGVYFVILEGDGLDTADTDMVVDLGGQVIGSSGLLVIKAASGGFSIPAGTTVVESSLLNEGGTTPFENGSTTFALISSPTTPIVHPTDLDTDNNGTLDLPEGASALDTAGWIDAAGERAYGAVLSTAFTPPGAATRFAGNTSPNTAAAWYYGQIAGAANNGLTYSASGASANIPPGAAITPGAANVGSPVDNPPAVLSTVPSNGSSNIAPGATISISFNEPVDVTASAVGIDCVGSSPTFTGLPANDVTQIVLDPTADLPIGTCQVFIEADQVSDNDGTADHLQANYTFSFTVNTGIPVACPTATSLTRISAVQGTGASTPLNGTTVVVQGVVTGVFRDLSGFYLEEETPDRDNDPASSEGLFIYMGEPANVPVSLAVGQTVRVQGVAREFTSSGSSMTELGSTTNVPVVTDCNTPGSQINPVDISFPLTAVGDLERYEGMLVRLPQTLTISEYFDFDRYGEIMLALPLPGEPRLIQPTNIDEPGGAATQRALANSLRQIVLDDGRSSQNPDPAIHPNGSAFTLANRFRGGDTVAGVAGMLDESSGAYRIQPTAYGTYTATNPRPTQPPDVGGTLKVAALNTLNYFLTLTSAGSVCGPQKNQDCRGADNSAEFQRQRNKTLAALLEIDADIFGLMELENTTGVDPLQDLVSGLNATLGAGTYAYIDTGVIGGDAIRVGIIYKPSTVTPQGQYKLLTSAVDARFIDTRNRPSLAQTFVEQTTGQKFTLVVNHLKSKGSACTGDPDTGDGQGNCNQTRTQAAQALVDWLAGDPTGSGDPDFLIVGDLNSYARENPIDAIIAGSDGYNGTADDYTNMVERYQGRFAYSYLFGGQVGYLDHALASATLANQVKGTVEWHTNADEPDILDYDTSFKKAAQDALYEPNAFRAADHDPVIVGLGLGQPGQAPKDKLLHLPLLRN